MCLIEYVKLLYKRKRIVNVQGGKLKQWRLKV